MAEDKDYLEQEETKKIMKMSALSADVRKAKPEK